MLLPYYVLLMFPDLMVIKNIEWIELAKKEFPNVTSSAEANHQSCQQQAARFSVQAERWEKHLNNPFHLKVRRGRPALYQVKSAKNNLVVASTVTARK